MKSIDESAKERAGLKKNQRIDDEERYYNGHLCEKYFCFKSGVEFAQKWIPVEEELPSEENELINVPVICITGFGNYRISKYNGNEWDSDEIVTFWRPIERQ